MSFLEMPKTIFTLWYKQDVSTHLHTHTKIDIAKRISELTLKSPIWIDPETNYIAQFPELRAYSHTGHVSGLQLCAVMEAIVKEMQEQ